MADHDMLRDHVIYLLRGGGAHAPIEMLLADWPRYLRGAKPPGQPHTPWRLLEHLRIAQWDILEFCRDPAHVSPRWPEGYWPADDAPPDTEAWERSCAAFRADLASMEALVANPEIDLLARFPHGDGQTLLREALLVADHNAYHQGQLAMLRRLLGLSVASTS